VNRQKRRTTGKNQKGEENGSAKKASLGAVFGRNITAEEFSTIGG